MFHFQFISKNENDTKNFAKNFASYLQKKDIIVLTRRFRKSEKLNLLKEYYVFLD